MKLFLIRKHLLYGSTKEKTTWSFLKFSILWGEEIKNLEPEQWRTMKWKWKKRWCEIIPQKYRHIITIYFYYSFKVVFSIRRGIKREHSRTRSGSAGETQQRVILTSYLLLKWAVWGSELTEWHIKYLQTFLHMKRVKCGKKGSTCRVSMCHLSETKWKCLFSSKQRCERICEGSAWGQKQDWQLKMEKLCSPLVAL